MRFLKLASNQIDPPTGAGFIWPYSVDLGVDGPRPRVVFAEGVAHGGFGGHFGVRDALSGTWRKHFREARGEWVLDYLHRIARGDTVTEQELSGAYAARHGRPPEHYGWDLPPISTRFLKLATSSEPWPSSVDVSVDERPALVAFSHGTGHASSGGVFSLRSALSPKWAEHMDKTGGDWLVPLLRGMSAGDDLSEPDLELAYMERYGHPPESYNLTTMNWRG